MALVQMQIFIALQIVFRADQRVLQHELGNDKASQYDIFLCQESEVG
jgi:hypothetical protein